MWFEPLIVYGTAWKKDRTAELVKTALDAGFRGIDTACQPRHYQEKLVGDGLQAAFASGIKRESIFVQTKFTPERGQDPATIPYDPRHPIEQQIRASFEVSKANLRVGVIDSLVLHSPLATIDETLRAWAAMEEIYNRGEVRQLGMSNCYDVTLFSELLTRSRIKPRVLQNRFYSETNWDLQLRRTCRENGVVYQSFWTLSANPDLLSSKLFGDLAHRYQASPALILFQFLCQHGVQPLTGTTSLEHMKEDLRIGSFEISSKDCAAIDRLGPFI